MGLLYGRAGRLTTKNAGFRPGQWVKKASIIQEPQDGPYETSQWEHSTASSTVKVPY